MVLDVTPVIPPDLRPLVLLESGNFATSDLNDLYRRIINRNNRLKKLMDLNAPEVIIRNEKRMLQQAVDSLLDNGRCRRPVLGSNNRPLKSLSDMIKGKQGRFRENLLGKRVDYSARSVIVVGPTMQLHQCGLPKRIALELYQPFIIRRLKQSGLADTIKSAKKMIEKRGEQIWDILEEVIHQHPVLLNRAPTLHRMGVQAFEPVLVEGNAIMLHPLACKGFNADFDGDQMAVHLPLSVEAQTEAHTLMMTTNNIFSPANGSPMVGPSQDMVLGNYYLTSMLPNLKGNGMVFKDPFEAMLAYDMGKIALHARIKVRLEKPAVKEGEKAIHIKMVGNSRSSNLDETDLRRLYMIEKAERTGGLAFKWIVTEKGGKVLSKSDLKAIESKVARAYPQGKNRPCPEFNGKLLDEKSIEDAFQRNSDLHGLFTECKEAVTNEKGWVNINDFEEYKKLPEDDPQGIYFFKSLKTGNVSDGYVGLAGEEKKTSPDSQGLRRRMKNHLKGDFMADNLVSTFGEREVGKYRSNTVETTVGRCMFNDILPAKMPFYNSTMGQKTLSQVISDCYEIAGSAATVDLLDRIKEKGFRQATLSGLSFGVMDLKIPPKKTEIIDETEKRVKKIQKNYLAGVLTEGERYNQVIDAWTNARVAVTNEMMRGLKEDTNDDGSPYLNPIHIMSISGARGSVDQIQQLAGMRALMAKPGGEIIETPIKSNFREGLTVLEYFSSTHGARKGLADTALKTANSGYLTRKLIDVAQNMIVTERDCSTLQGITKSTVTRGEQVDIPLSQLIIGRTARDNIRNPITDEMIVRENEVITPEAAAKVEALGLDAIRVRSPLTCDSPFGICAKCYGWDMSTGLLVEEGLPVGIIAAQSIGEPGTQLTLRTFHTGGIASRTILESDQKAGAGGIVKFRDINPVEEPPELRDYTDRRGKDYENRPIVDKETGETHYGPVRKGWIALKRNGEIVILDDKNRELEKYKVPYGAHILPEIKDGNPVKSGQKLFWWDPHRTPILAEVAGVIRFVDIVEGETIRFEEERKGQTGKPVIIEHKGDKHPQIMIEDTDGKILDVHYLPAGARIEVTEGQKVQAGQLLSHQPRATGGTQDITGGLPRVTEVFEARKPKDPAAIAEISGRVELKSDKRKGKMTIIIRSEEAGTGKTIMEKEHHVPRDRHLNVHTSDIVEAGDALTDGPLVPHDILRIKGEEALQRYLIGEIQNVYRSQNVNINDKHIEIICAQMMRKVEIESVGDSAFLPGEMVDKFEFRRENLKLNDSVRIADVGDSTELKEGQVIEKAKLATLNEKLEAIGGEPAKGKKPRFATAKTLLLGITKASLRSDSFIAAASFQQTTKVLTEAALGGSVDKLCGLKENVILGHLIPAGTAFKPYLELKVKHLAEAPLPKEFKEVTEIEEAKEAEAQKEAKLKEALGIK
jgi:DNA-directed RNA polymerase beta' subunit